MGSLTNSVKDIAAFPKVISAVTTCHAAAMTLSQGKFFILRKLGKPKLPAMTKIHSAGGYSLPQIGQMRRYWITTLIFVHFIEDKIVKM